MPSTARPRHFAAAFLFLVAAALLTPIPPAHAQDDFVTLQAGPELREAERDDLFSALASARSEAIARRIVADIWLFWFAAPDAEAARLMGEALSLRARGDLKAGLAVLDDLVVVAPTWAEAWNQRATLRFMVGDFQGSLADIDAVLPLEPKHFGALSGQAMILRRLGQDDEAQAVLREAVKINPFLADRVLLKPEPEGEDI